MIFDKTNALLHTDDQYSVSAEFKFHCNLIIRCLLLSRKSHISAIQYKLKNST